MIMPNAEFTDLDWKCINTVRVLAADMVQAANSGHPGAPMGLAPVAHVLFTRFFKFDPKNPKWIGRDRFVLSNGHACALQYAMLHLLGYELSLNDLKNFRQLDSKTPGHPECHLTPGVEVTTGPLGQGFANAVGLAMAEAHLAATFNQDANAKLIDNYTYVFVGDGCMQEGVACEAASLAGHWGLGKLIVFYDDNHISIDGGTELSFTEDVEQRFKAYGYHTQYVAAGDNDLEGIARAIQVAQGVTDKPSLIRIKTTIGIGSHVQGTAKAHGAPLGPDSLAAVKAHFGLDPAQHFAIPEDVLAYYRAVGGTGAGHVTHWDGLLQSYRQTYPDLAAEFQRRLEGRLPDNWAACLPTFGPDAKPAATRKISETVLMHIANTLPELMGGSADLTPSNLTKWKGSVDFQRPSQLGSPAGRYVRFGVREHGMFAIANGLDAYGLLIPFTSTFLNFISYGLGAVRLAALSHHRVLYIMTHDSIGLGEDGPTHQPVETLAALRAMPNLCVFRPADGNEVSGAYKVAIENRRGPSVLALSRQNVAPLAGTSIEMVAQGAYIVKDAGSGATPDIILVGTGSELELCFAAEKVLQSQSLNVRIVSMPCCELFDAQPLQYQLSVLPAAVPVISIEAGSTFGWQKYAHASIGLDSFGASGPYEQVYAKFGITTEALVSKSLKLAKFYKSHPVPNLRESPFAKDD